MPIYIGNQKINVSGVDKVYVGSQLVYQAGGAVLDYIVLSGQTTSIDRDQPFSFGGVVTAYYTDGTSADVTADATFSGYNMSTAGTYTVTVSYTEADITVTETYSLVVNKAWTAVWTGSASWSYNGSSSSGNNVNIYTTPANEGYNTSNYRVYFTMSASGGSGSSYTTRYYKDNDLSTIVSKPASPHSWSTTLTGNATLLRVDRRYSSSSSGYSSCAIRLIRNTSTNNFTFRTQVQYSSSYSTGLKTSMTCTKIEKYY